MKHITKRLLALALTLALVVGALPAAVFAVDATEISSLEEITDLNGAYLLVQDITVTQPFGTKAQPFNGSFDGGGHKITLNISATSDYAGMFAALGADATVKSFTVEDSTVTNTASYTGLVAGSSAGDISDVVVKSSTVHGYKFIGGIVGLLEAGATVTRCAFESGSIAKLSIDSSDTGIGGVVGENNGTISLCSNAAPLSNDVGGTNCGYIGGVVGNNKGSVTDCYNTGEIRGNFRAYYAAGVVGRNYSGTVTNAHNTGAVSVPAGTKNAVTNRDATNCFYLDTSFTDYTSIGVKKTAEEFRTLAASLGENWTDGFDGYPVLQWQTWKYSNTAISYAIEQYVESVDGTGYTLYDTLSERAEPGDAVSYTPEAISGFTFDEENSENLLSGSAADTLVLKAYYSRNSYQLSWEVGDGVIDPSAGYTNGSVKYGTEIIAPTVTKTGHELQWDKSVGTMPAEDTTFTATWTPALYKVTFDANGGSCSVASWNGTLGSNTDKVTYGRLYGEYKSTWGYSSRSLPVPLHAELAFNGWYTLQEGGTLVTKDTVVTATQDHTLYAQWVEGHSITFDANGGYLSGTSAFCVKHDEAFNTYFSVNTPTRSGYSFDGWYDAQNTAFSAAAAVTASKTYYAKWTPYTYYVNFNANSGTGSMERQSFTVGTEQALSKCTLTKPGNRFLGWATWSSATEAYYADEAIYTQLPSYDGYVYTVYAVWQEVRHELRFSVTPDDAEITLTNASGKTQTPKDGVYTLLEGSYSYTITRYGYKTIEATIDLTDDTTLTLSMEKLPSYLVSFDVSKPEGTGEVSITVTTADGEEILPLSDGSYDLIPGDYRYVVTAAGCGKVKADFEITNAGQEFTIALTLRTAWDGETRTEPQTITAEEAVGAYEGMEGWYRITNGDELAWFANLVNTTQGGCSANAVLANDIDLGSELWTPMGSSYNYNFTGIFDGAFHTVKGLYCNGADYQGLFGYSKGTIRKLLIEGEVTASGSNAGGIVAYQNSGSISSCGSYVRVTSTHASGRCGGIAGYAYNAGITSCFNAGALTGGMYLGGIAGYPGGTMNVTDCYNIGTLTGSDSIVETAYVFGNAGGILGNASEYVTMNVTNCYNAGALEQMDKYSRVGAIIGTRGSASISNCVYLNTASKGIGNGSADGAQAVTQEVLLSDDTLLQLGAGYKKDDGCGGTNPVLTWQSVKEHVLATDEAVAPGCTADGLTEGSHCTVCGKVITQQQTVSALGHSATATAAKAATCTEAGNTAYWYCATCEKYFSDEACTAEITLAETVLAALGHSATATAAKAATCTEAGNTAYWYCSVCEKYFSNEACTAETTLAETVLAALGHSATATAAKAATCTEAGNTAYWYCSVCEKYFSNEACTAETTLADTVLAALGHSATATAAKAATCTEAGNTAYWYCATCEKYFSDEACTAEITLAETVLAALGHSATATAAKAATCTEAGNTAYWYCSVCEKYFSDEACTAETTLAETVLAALGHSATATAAKAATCTEAGNTAYWYCSVCEKYFSDEACTAETTLADTVLAALGHSFGEWEITVAPTCTKPGERIRTCSVCGEKETEAMAAAACPSAAYTDVAKTAWYHDAVDYAVENKLMNGMSKTLFAPEEALTRAQLVTILYRAAGEPSVSGTENPFKDVAAGKWYTNAIVWAAKNGIVNGMSPTQFQPDTAITREQIATILYRYAKAQKAEEDKLGAYPDAKDVSNYAKEAMNWAIAEGIINGLDGKLLPLDNATRAQIAAILMRWIESK